MKTAEIAAHLAVAASRFEFLGKVSAADLIALVTAELGHPEALDDFQPYGGHHARAIGPASILHIVSGNTPAAALQSLIRGLLLGAHNCCKMPAAGLPQIAEFQAALPPSLAARLEIATELPEAWLETSEVVIVFGSDATIAHFQSRVSSAQIFIPHGHMVSFGVVLEDAAFASVAGAARDASVFDQQGCLSPQVYFVGGDARAYAERLADAMARYQAEHPRGAVSLSEANAIRTLREEIAFRSANGEPVAVWQSPGATAWTVVFDASPGFPASPLNRFIFVTPLPADLPAALANVHTHLSTCGYWPATLDHARTLAGLGIARLCPVGRMQLPPLTWHQDGRQVLAPLVRWIDAETFHG